MKLLWARFSLTLIATLLAGCGNLERQSRVFETTGTGGITIDASQRAIYSVSKSDNKNGVKREWTAVCAEPSPDAISALASSFGLDAAVASKAIGLAINSQDSTASIGLRTQTIQLLRDAMYRLCEGYASGALDATGFSRLQRRYQHVMLALLAIEQLTGPVVAQQLALSGASGVSLGKSLGELGQILAKGASDLAAANQALTDADAHFGALTTQVRASTAAGSSTATITALKTQLAEADKEREAKGIAASAAKTYYVTLEAKLKDSERIVASSAGSVYGFSPAASALIGGDTSSIAVVSAHVGKIVETVINQDYTKDVCVDVLLDVSTEISVAKLEVIGPMCATAFNMDSAQTTRFLGSIRELSTTVKRAPKAPPLPPAK